MQISDWFTSFLWLFIKEHIMLLIGALGAISTTIGAYFAFKLLRPKAKPSIVDPEISINLSDFVPYNAAIGRFIADNDGPKPCNILNVKVSANNLTFDICTVAENIVLGVTDLGQRSGELPAFIKGNEQKTFSFRGTHNIKMGDELPQSLILEVTFSSNKEPIRKRLNRIADTDQYR